MVGQESPGMDMQIDPGHFCHNGMFYKWTSVVCCVMQFCFIFFSFQSMKILVDMFNNAVENYLLKVSIQKIKVTISIL
jgi:hypothetical protein